MKPFQFIALTPPGLTDPSIAIAASRAGELGVFDLAYAENDQVALSGISKIAQYTNRDCGIRLNGRDGKFINRVTSDLPKQIQVVILSQPDPGALRLQIKTFHDQNLVVLVETTCLDQAFLAAEAGADGLIAKGHEAGGWVGQETTFILIQQLLSNVSLPVWAQGGIGLHTAAACYTAGAAGVVLDGQLALTYESPLLDQTKVIIARMDGSETICLGEELGESCRLYDRPGSSVVHNLQGLLRNLTQYSDRSGALVAWHREIRRRVGWENPEQNVWLLGQDIAFAASLAQRFRTVGGVLEGMRRAIETHIRSARVTTPFDEASPLARSHGTQYPIVQGPMTRVSDRPAFAAKVADEGALPFLALGMLRAPELKPLFAETQQLLGKRPWGVGILGFVPLELRQEQLKVIRAYRPPFALIAGGRPDQARTLEQEGISTYLHVPSPGLLKMFLENGARRFIFEGREGGGHIGPRSSFVLWNLMIDELLEVLPPEEAAICHVLFAGGIHDDLSSAMVATLAAPLAERGVRVGVLLGTAYLFTEEAVATEAIVKGFQEEAVRCCQTVELESGPGHVVRCAATPYAETFRKEKQRLSAEKESAEDLRNTLEALNLGRLRIAAKGVTRHPDYGTNPEVPKYIEVEEEQRYAKGLYMIGQVAALRSQTCTMKKLHNEISVKGSQRLSDRDEPALSSVSLQHKEKSSPSDIAIIGIASILPKAPDFHTYWENILNKVDAISEVPEDRWDWRIYYDPDPKKRDKIYSKWGGFLDAIPFDPMRYGMPPNSLTSIEPLQLLTLETVRAALQDAGYADRPFDRERTSVILGVGGGIGDLGQKYAFRSNIPMFLKNASPEVMDQFPEWTEDSFPGILLNVTAGRVANRFDLGGVNYTVDAACASSLAAVYLAVSELETEASDMIIVGGGDTAQGPFGYLCFSKTQALSPTGRCRTFDESGDGTVISEGVASVVLKRLADAERDGDRIYAVIKGVGASSDGRDKGLTAPRPEGQKRALDRAYSKAGFSPAGVELIEAHGTGTVAGDQAEIETLKLAFEEAGASQQSCALGSVKSMIGHTKCAAGVAGLIKIALALYHKVLPPTIGVTKPNSSLAESPLYVNTKARPWIKDNEQPRRAGVSAFGFGGSNFHAALEEYTGNFLDTTKEAVSRQWPSELFIFTGQSHRELLADITSLDRALEEGAKPALPDLSYTLWQKAKGRSGLRIAVVATSFEDLREKLGRIREHLSNAAGSEPIGMHDPRGIYFTEKPLCPQGRVAFLFPGQGSQYPYMLLDLAIHFREVTEQFEIADRVLSDQFSQPLSAYAFPPPCFSEEGEKGNREALTQTNVAQPAIGAANMGLFQLLQAFGVRPHMVAGHSYGEITALCAARVIAEDVLYTLSETRGRLMMEAAGQDLGIMAAVEAPPEHIETILDSVEGVWLANMNAPRQTIISGTQDGVKEAFKRLEAQGIRTTEIPVSCAFHSPLMRPVKQALAEFLSTVEFAVPEVEVFSNTLAAAYPQDPKAICALLSEHLIRPVKFFEQIEAMYQAGARIFIEVGPRNILTSLTEQILDGRPSLTVALDMPGRSGLLQLQHALGQLVTCGVPIQLDRLYQGRGVRQLNLKSLVEETKTRAFSPTTWMVEGGKVWPLEAKVATPDFAPSERDSTLTETNGSQYRTSQRTSASKGADTSSMPPKSKDERQAIEPLANRPDHSEADQVMLQYQQMMNRFLEVQQQVMLTFLGSDTHREATYPFDASELKNKLSPLTVPPPSPSFDELTFDTMQPSQGADGRQPETSPQETSTPMGSLGNEAHAEAIPVEMSIPESGTEELKAHILIIVSERTGYPVDMLDLNADLEADLGIDSIKRVEILGTIQKTYFSSKKGLGQEAMDVLTGLKTLQGIIDWLCTALGTQSDEQVHEAVVSHEEALALPASGETSEESEFELPRFLLTAVEAPSLIDQPLQIPPGGLLLITDDERGIGQIMADELRRLGGCVALVRMGNQVSEKDQGLYTADLADLDSVTRLVELVRQRQGDLSGIIHLLPLRGEVSFEEMSFKEWQERLRLEAKSLFYLAKAAAKDLKKAARSGLAWVVGVTAMGGSFAVDMDELPSFFPGQGAVVGLVKTLAIEWPDVRCKSVDLNLESPPATLAGHLLREMACTDGEVEVGYRGSRRFILRTARTLLEEREPATLGIDSNWVVVVTGGARGITAEVALELARRYRPILLLAGRSALPEGQEGPDTAGLFSPLELKAALIDKMRRADKKVTPAQVDAAYTRLCQAREMRSHLSAMKQAGGEVHYYQVDVRDEHAFSQFIDEIYKGYGRLDLFIHGAGIIEDKLIEDKTGDSFDRVFDTKANSAFILGQKLRGESLRGLVFFSSVAGRFGNRGQIDYVASNEVVNKLAVLLDYRWPGRVVAINWGPWAKSGMVSPEVQRQFLDSGVQPIQPSAGRRMLDKELRYGQKGQVELIIGKGPWETVEDRYAIEPHNGLPLLHGASLKSESNGALRVIRTLDPTVDQYLRDHRLDGKPVFPAAMAAELMAEVVQLGWPGCEVTGINDLKVLKGIVLEGSGQEIQILAQPKATLSLEDPQQEVAVEIAALGQTDHPYYRATVVLGKRISPPPAIDPGVLSKLSPFSMTVDEAYERWLFHGPSLQGIAKIEGINEAGICAVLQPSSPGQCLRGNENGRWLIDPVLLDSAFQLAILWERTHFDMTPLPSGFAVYHRFHSSLRFPVRCYLQTKSSADGLILSTNIQFLGEDGHIIAFLKEMQFSCTKALNRLAGTAESSRGNG